jgi:CheY-like chemotaxis protein
VRVRRARVVVADNDPEALDLAMLDLRLEGHTVAGAAGGDAVPALVERFAPDVVVLDYRMPPGPDGLAVAERLRQEHPDLPLVLYTNYSDEGLMRRSTELGVFVLPKGNLRALRATVAGQV